MTTEILKYSEEKFWTMTPKEIVIRAKIHKKFKNEAQDETGFIDQIF